MSSSDGAVAVWESLWAAREVDGPAAGWVEERWDAGREPFLEELRAAGLIRSYRAGVGWWAHALLGPGVGVGLSYE